MRSIEFSEEQLADLATIGKELFEDTSDPRSRFYKRVLVRPKISLIKVVIWVLIAVMLVACVFFASDHFSAPGWVFPLCALSVLCAYAALTAKVVLIFAVKLYQLIAPASIRKKCRFEPSCSQYMILCIEKYGAVRGTLKGIDRLKRCGPNDGGFDYP